jgi:hypothetical protein
MATRRRRWVSAAGSNFPRAGSVACGRGGPVGGVGGMRWCWWGGASILRPLGADLPTPKGRICDGRWPQWRRQRLPAAVGNGGVLPAASGDDDGLLVRHVSGATASCGASHPPVGSAALALAWHGVGTTTVSLVARCVAPRRCLTFKRLRRAAGGHGAICGATLVAAVGFFGLTRHLSVGLRQEDEALVAGNVLCRRCYSPS